MGVEIRYGKHRCPRFERYFNARTEDLAEPGGLYAPRVRIPALANVFVDGLPLEAVREQMLREFHMHVPRRPWIVGWSTQGRAIDLKACRDPWVVEDLSGYLWIKEICDWPYRIVCVPDPVLRRWGPPRSPTRRPGPNAAVFFGIRRICGGRGTGITAGGPHP